MHEHLIFYDGDCAFCHKSVLSILKEDERELFLFAPLEGETARELFIGPNAHFAKEDSLILVEGYRSDKRIFWIRSRAVFRIYWLMDNRWFGWMYKMPSFLIDWAYNWIAQHRHRLHFGWERPEYPKDRFLP